MSKNQSSNNLQIKKIQNQNNNNHHHKIQLNLNIKKILGKILNKTLCQNLKICLLEDEFKKIILTNNLFNYISIYLYFFT